VRRLTPGLLLLRIVAVGAIILLLWNPGITRSVAPGVGPGVVLLDASLSMAGRGGHWREALDTARALAHGGLIWRFGSKVGAFDTLPPADGASRLAPALAAAAGRGGPVTVVSDGAIDDLAQLPADLLARARVVLLPRTGIPDAYIASVTGPHQVGPGDTVTLHVTYGTAGRVGKREALKDSLTVAGGVKRDATLSVSLNRVAIVSSRVPLPDSGTLSTDLTFPVSRFPSGWSAIDVRISASPDSEPRDDVRQFVLRVTSEPAAVMLATPPDWDSKFLAQAIGDVAGVPLRVFSETEPGQWSDGATLAPVSASMVSAALARARLAILVGEPARVAGLTTSGAVLEWRTGGGVTGDWYVAPQTGSPLSGALAGLAWDSLPPASGIEPLASDSGAMVVLQGALARRGAPHPIAIVRESRSGRRAIVTATGLYRWAFRGGAAGEAYRTLVAGLVDWLLVTDVDRGAWARLEQMEVPRGLPVVWHWTGPGEPRDLGIRIEGAGAAGLDTLRFGAAGGAELLLPPGTYHYTLGTKAGGAGAFVVETYSDEWRPAGPVLQAQEGGGISTRITIDWRERWWLFALAVAAFGAEWAWRRRLGLP
jgi:hypothetical protein